MNHECCHRTDCDAGTDLQCCGIVQHLKHYGAEFVPPPPPVTVFSPKTCERHHSRNKDSQQTGNHKNTSFIDQDDGLSLGKQTLCNQRSFQRPNIYSLQPANVVHLDGDAAFPNSKVHNFSKDNTPTITPTFLVQNAPASSVRTNASNVSSHGLFNSVSSSGDYLASQANVPPSKTERNVDTSFTASNSNSFGLVITTNLDSDNQNRHLSQFEPPFLNIKALGGSIPRVHAKPVVYVDNVPQRRSSSLVTTAPDRTDQQRRYVTELKLDLRRGRAHRMTSNWRSNSSGRASPADSREEIFETDPVLVKAVLCRAAPNNCIEDDIPTKGTQFEGYVVQQPLPYCEKNHSVSKKSPECDIRRESRTCSSAITDDKLSARQSNLDYLGATAVNVKCATPKNHLVCLGSLGVTYSAEQLKAKRTPQFNLMEQSQISPSTISSTSTGGLKGRNLSTDSTLPPPTSNTPRWSNTQPETMEINEMLNNARFLNFRTNFSRVQKEICLDDTSGTSAYTHLHSPTTEKPPSVKTSGDCVSSKTVVSTVAGKTSRGTQSEQFKTVKVVRDVQIQTGPFEDQETQTTESKGSNKACATHLTTSRVVNTPKSHALQNGTSSKHSPGYTESRQASKALRRPLIDEISSVRSGGLSAVSPNKFNTLPRVEHLDSANARRGSPNDTVGAGDHANTNDWKPSHMAETQMINSSRLGDESSNSRTLYQVVGGQTRAEPNQWDKSEVARTTNPQLCQNSFTLAAGGLPTLKRTPTHEEKFGANTSGVVPSSPDLVLKNVTGKAGEQQQTTKPIQDSESVGTREQVTFSIFQNEDVVLVDGLNTPNLCQSSVPQSPNVAVPFKNDPQTVVTLTASTDPRPQKGPCAATSDECQKSSNSCSCCCRQAECGLSASSSPIGSESCQCSCCLTPKFGADNCALNVPRLPSAPEAEVGARRNTRCVGKMVYDGTRGHTCDIVYDPSGEASGQNAYRQKMTSTSSTASSASCDECSSQCSCYSESCASEKVPEQVPTRRPTSPFVNNRNYIRQDLPPPVKNDASRAATLNRFILGANETGQLSKQRNTAQSDEKPTYKEHRKPNLVLNKTFIKPSSSAPSKPSERTPSQVLSTPLQQKSVELVEESAGQHVPQNTVKPSSKLDTLFNMVSDKEKRIILQRWLLEQVAYSTKRNQQTQNKNDKAQRKREHSPRTGNAEAGNGSVTECTCTKCRNAVERRSLSADSKDTLNCCLDANQNTRCQSNIQQDDHAAHSNRFGRENMKVEIGRNEHCSQSQARISRLQTVYRRSSAETPNQIENDSNIFGRRDRRATSEDPRMSAIGNSIRGPTENTIPRTRASQSADRMAFEDQSPPGVIDPQVAKRTLRRDSGDRVRNLREIRYSPAGDEDRGLNYAYKCAEKGNTGGRTTNHGVLNDQPTDPRKLPMGLIPPTTRKGGPDMNTRPAWNNYAMKPSLELTQASSKKDERLNTGPKFGQSRLRASMYASSNTPTVNVERIFELSQYDDLVKSHLNRADRRIKAVGLKNGCDIRIVGPISTNEQPITGSGPGRSKVSYHCHIAAPTEEKVWKCVNFLKETFPNSFLRSSWRA
ncbi:hypothetical protein CRM22_007907 [Opisthorchis felineus]|uniref:Uncharacterized protein n=1 Tax=Opisthorchis felineus TaxID=147828 RepID=A0A4S2LE08_OPIFE|nr:hypothetical protein CRM22_007907 [Opisthorchis felineus]